MFKYRQGKFLPVIVPLTAEHANNHCSGRCVALLCLRYYEPCFKFEYYWNNDVSLLSVGCLLCCQFHSAILRLKWTGSIIARVLCCEFSTILRKALISSAFRTVKLPPRNKFAMKAERSLKSQWRTQCVIIHSSIHPFTYSFIHSFTHNISIYSAVLSEVHSVSPCGLSGDPSDPRLILCHMQISSMGSGLDHVMDAITECEQLARSQGRLESSASWKLYYQKELFTPWFSPSNDPVGTELIFRQIINGVHLDEYKLHVVRLIR